MKVLKDIIIMKLYDDDTINHRTMPIMNEIY